MNICISSKAVVVLWASTAQSDPTQLEDICTHQ